MLFGTAGSIAASLPLNVTLVGDACRMVTEGDILTVRVVAGCPS